MDNAALPRELRKLARWLDTIRKGINRYVRPDEYHQVRRQRDICRQAAARLEMLTDQYTIRIVQRTPRRRRR